MKTRLSITILCLTLLSANLLGQNYKKGFVITNQQDTLRGLIQDAGTIRNTKVCVFKTDLHSIPVKYYPADIKCFALDGDKQYQSQEVFDKGIFNNVFMEVLIKGYVNLYYYDINNEMKFFIEKTKDSLVGLTNIKVSLPFSSAGLYGRIKNDYAPLQSERLEEQFNTNVLVDLYKDTLAALFRDQPKLLNELHNLKYTHRSIMGITKEYIFQACGENNCLEYEKNMKLLKPFFGFYSGFQLSNIVYWKSKGVYGQLGSKVSSKTFPSVPFGAFVEFPVRRISDLYSIKVGIKFNNIEYNQGWIDLPDSLSYIIMESHSLGFPVSIHYRVLNKKLSPTIGVGKEITLVSNSEVAIGPVNTFVLNGFQKGCWFAEAGLDYKIKPRLILFTDLRFERFRNLIVSENGTAKRATYSNVMNYNYYDLFYTRCLSLHLGIKF